MRRTPEERDRQTERAKRFLRAKCVLFAYRHKLIGKAREVWGEPSMPVSGCYDPRYSEPTKRVLRALAAAQTRAVDESYCAWTKGAGRRRNTWLRLRDAMHVPSYY